jgi:hypothetical protein
MNDNEGVFGEEIKPPSYDAITRGINEGLHDAHEAILRNPEIVAVHEEVQALSGDQSADEIDKILGLDSDLTRSQALKLLAGMWGSLSLYCVMGLIPPQLMRMFGDALLAEAYTMLRGINTDEVHQAYKERFKKIGEEEE